MEYFQVTEWMYGSGVSKLFGGPGEKTECGALLADGKKFVTGYTDGSIRYRLTSYKWLCVYLVVRF